MSLKDFCLKRVNFFLLLGVLAIYVAATFSNPYFFNFNHDEIHAWNIASNFGFFDIIRLMRSEGHTFIWFMLIKPFTSFSIYSIKFLNWMFTFLAVTLLWIFAPFKPVEKFLITFSCPFLLIYPIVARCYGIGILLLFMVAILHKKRFERPILFSILIFLAANTSLMAAIPASVLGLIYSLEMIKHKQKVIPLLILLLVPISLYIQWHNPIIPSYTVQYDFKSRVIDFLFGRFLYNWCEIIAIAIYPLILVLSFLFFRMNTKILLFWLLSSSVLLSVFVFVYCGFDYHFYFFYIYLILAYWLMPDMDNLKCRKFFVIAFCALSFLFCMKTVSNEWHFKTYYKENASCIMDGIVKGSTIYTNLYEYNILLPYMDRSMLKDYDGNSLVSFENFQKIYLEHKSLDLNKLYRIAPKNSYVLLKANSVKGKNLDFSKKTNYRECGADILYKIK